MLSFEELWKRLNDLDETVEIEAKTSDQAGSSALETISAFSNEPGRGGGYLVLGVRLAPGSLFPGYEVVGVRDADKLQADLATQCRQSFNRPVRPEIVVENRGGKRVVVVHVPEAPAGDKPIYIEARGLPKGAYRRIGSTDQKCTDDDTLVASAHLRHLRDIGLLSMKGKSAGTHYVPTAELEVVPRKQVKPNGGMATSRTPLEQELAPVLAAQKQEFNRLRQEFPRLTQGLAEAVVALGGRATIDQVRRLIVRLCGRQPLTSDDLARILKRKKAYVARKYLAPMLRAGELKYTIPDNPNHPKQAYRAP